MRKSTWGRIMTLVIVIEAMNQDEGDVQAGYSRVNT